MVKPKPLATQQPFVDAYDGGFLIYGDGVHYVDDVDELIATADAINAAHFAAVETLRGQLAAAREALVEARRCLFFSAKDLRQQEGPDSVLCELVEEEAHVKALDELLAALDADEPFVPRRLLEESEHRHVLRDQADESDAHVMAARERGRAEGYREGFLIGEAAGRNARSATLTKDIESFKKSVKQYNDFDAFVRDLQERYR